MSFPITVADKACCSAVRTVHKLSYFYCFQFFICLRGTLAQFILHFLDFLSYVFKYLSEEEGVTSCRTYAAYVYCSVQVLLQILSAVLYI
jgi:hypothetical protein